jgi:hypothetical protein
MVNEDTLISRHRLNDPYRTWMVALWLAPVVLLVGAIVIGNGMTPALFDPRLLLPLGIMALPAFYVWQEGIDVLAEGIVRRIAWPRYYAYEALAGWHLKWTPEGRILIVLDGGRRTVLSVHAAHLTDLPVLIEALDTNLDRLT